MISVSVFTHLDEATQKLYLAELARVSARGAWLFLTTSGERALARALSEDRIFELLAIPAPILIAPPRACARVATISFSSRAAI